MQQFFWMPIGNSNINCLPCLLNYLFCKYRIFNFPWSTSYGIHECSKDCKYLYPLPPHHDFLILLSSFNLILMILKSTLQKEMAGTRNISIAVIALSLPSELSSWQECNRLGPCITGEHWPECQGQGYLLFSFWTFS